MTDVDPKTGPGSAGEPPRPAAPEPDEFAGIPSRRPRSLWLAAVAALLASALAVHMRKDLGFALSSADPVDLGDARRLGAPGGPAASPSSGWPLNRVVRLAGLPDRESAVILDTQGAWTFAQFFRLLGTDSRVFVRRLDDPLPPERAERDVFVGRLVRLADLPFDGSIRAHFERHVTSTHVFRPAALAAALRAGAAELTDVAGDRVRLTAEDTVVVDVRRPGELRVEVPADRFGSVGALRSRLAELGAALVDEDGAEAAPSPGDRLAVNVRLADDRRDAVLSALEAVDRRVHLRHAVTSVRARVGELAVEGDALVLRPAGAPARPVPVADVASVRTVAPVTIPADAVVLLEGERPRDHFRTLVVLALLLTIAGVNLATTLLRSRR